ncbi:50S ribosomal protein L25/general stress protein Ctc [Streptomyces aidingensis]|uniref:Large ribosomal subunit protein bL25 n=1 Tax=Streptomyces aidingensis TaxID=910347 RepID=A0A1I1GU33_9ACTN|nr:50S ribosomal protein L25/general stress protein Ctc [Streptomyces aidingensis]SFC14995.1 large subunit ribosomal protein L25 [Streptomyces aidingensis]
MADVKISAEIRKEFGKGSARRARAKDRIPGVIYGHGTDPVHVLLPGYDLMMALKNPNVLITLDVEGRQELVIPKAVQREVLVNRLVHVDLLVVKRGEQVTVDVPVHIEGDLAPGQHVTEQLLSTVRIEAEATHLPEYVVASVQGLAGGDHVLAKDLKLAPGSVLGIDGEEVVVAISSAQAAEAPAEGEGGSEEA